MERKTGHKIAAGFATSYYFQICKPFVIFQKVEYHCFRSTV